ncbi:homogentisate 1,2-dioxygenase [Novosphingobium sp. ERN07]|uniref:homogentisate 1,2-dioxygenase n=1 Tax=Novosphingobium sp. ERN07 TaxID=2726187 RepID=UPI00145686C0|nr:homogentisate 1,2-dioxygenase [Novosphingobium sp. ERN07]NLR71227.1 homogentisate 1,2-dioxygenase [Novosphingobium sp. ERN07]
MIAIRTAALALLCQFTTPAYAQSAPECPPSPSDALWPQGAPRAADGTLTLGTPAQIGLTPDGKGKHKGGGSITVTAPGTYEFALGSAAWIDVAKDGVVLTSTSHGHGPACAGIRKIVGFALQPGTYDVRLSRSDSDTVQVMASLSR